MYIQNGILNILESTVLAFCNQLAQAANAQLITRYALCINLQNYWGADETHTCLNRPTTPILPCPVCEQTGF